MPLNTNSVAATATTTAGAATVTVTGVAGTNYQIVGYSGGCSNENFKIELKKGSTVMSTNYGSTSTSFADGFEEFGPVAGQGTDLSVVVTPTTTAGACSANIVYFITTI